LYGESGSRIVHNSLLLWVRNQTARRVFKKTTILTRPALACRDTPFHQQGRSEGRTEASPPGYVEGLNDARTKLGAFFNTRQLKGSGP